MGFMDRLNRGNAVLARRFAEHTAVVGLEDPVKVIYDEPVKPVEIYGEEVQSTAPSCVMADSDVESLGICFGVTLDLYKDGDPSGSFTVSSTEPDGAGFTRIFLTTAEA